MTSKTVIVCSYGPRKATHGSLRRIRSMVDASDQVIVYAGTRSGFADAGKTSGVEVIEEHGRAGLLEALGRASGDHVLHITDGVTITAGGLGKLFAAAKRTEKLVTPWTNDLGTDHYVGALPTHGNTIQVLSDLGRRQPEARVRVLRPVCVGGTVRQLYGLTTFHLGYPTTTLRLVHDDCIAVEGAVAAHDGNAESRMLPPTGPDGRPLLVASMIVRDEEDFLEDCLKSLAGVVDRIDLCDTGSTDRTLEIARAFGCNIIEREWREDFGWARNEVLELGQDAWWSLWIDADERLVVADVDRMRSELATGIDHFDSLNAVIAAGNLDGSGASEDQGRWTTARLLRPERMRYEGALHEQVVGRDRDQAVHTTTLDGVEILHLGYATEVIDKRDKKQRNLSIAKASYEADTDSAVAALQYARSLWLSGAPAQERLELLEQARDGFTKAPASQIAFVNGLLARTLTDLGQHDRAFDAAVIALDQVPADDTAFSALLASAKVLDRNDEVLERLDTYAHGPSLQPAMEDPAGRAQNRAAGVRLLRDAGQADLAMQHTTELLAESHHDFPHWDLVMDGLLETRTPEKLVEELHHLLTTTEDGSWARPLATRLRRDLALALIEEHLAARGRSPEPVRVGLTLAMVMDDGAALMRLASQHAHLLPESDRVAMAMRLRERGATEVADILAPVVVPDAPTFLL